MIIAPYSGMAGREPLVSTGVFWGLSEEDCWSWLEDISGLPEPGLRVLAVESSGPDAQANTSNKSSPANGRISGATIIRKTVLSGSNLLLAPTEGWR
jgi:hypothetical protein